MDRSNDGRQLIRLCDELAAGQLSGRIRPLVRCVNDAEPRLGMPDVFRQRPSVQSARHVDVGQEDVDPGACREDCKGFVARLDSLHHIAAGLQLLREKLTQELLILGEEDPYGGGGGHSVPIQMVVLC